jgi:hypothetical protein
MAMIIIHYVLWLGDYKTERARVYNVWRYEKLPNAGDFLSNYTKVEAGYNP